VSRESNDEQRENSDENKQQGQRWEKK